jgi:hypothetical protein
MYKPIDTLDCIKNLLLKQTVFSLGEKTVRKGRVMLFSCSDYYVKFVIQTNKNVIKNYEIPYPYKVTYDKSHVNFSYQLFDLCKENEDKLQQMKIYTPPTNCNKLHDKKLTITIIEPV